MTLHNIVAIAWIAWRGGLQPIDCATTAECSVRFQAPRHNGFYVHNVQEPAELLLGVLNAVSRDRFAIRRMDTTSMVMPHVGRKAHASV